MHDLVVRERQHEVLGEGVQHREGEQVVLPPAVDGSSWTYCEHVVHPAHVPLVGEPEPAEMRRPAHAGHAVDSSAAVIVPGCSPWVSVLSRCRNSIASRFSRPPNWFGNPLPCRARVVQVEHRRHGVHAQAVDVILLEPEERVRQQEVPHLVPPVVEDERAPILMLALPRIGVLVERGAVEPRQAVRVFRESVRAPSRESRRCRPDGRRRRSSLKSSGGPKRLVGAKNPST